MSTSPSMACLLLFSLVFLALLTNMVMARLMPMESKVFELKLGPPKDATGPSIGVIPPCRELKTDSWEKCKQPQGKNHRYLSGGHVILIGLAITSFVIIFAYVWVTRGRNKKSMTI